jgi:hypothetical protein
LEGEKMKKWPPHAGDNKRQKKRRKRRYILCTASTKEKLSSLLRANKDELKKQTMGAMS